MIIAEILTFLNPFNSRSEQVSFVFLFDFLDTVGKLIRSGQEIHQSTLLHCRQK